MKSAQPPIRGLKVPLARIVFAGLVGGGAFDLAVFLTFGLFGTGLNQKGILLDSSIQSPKLVAVWTQIQPLPLLVTNPGLILAGFFVFSMGHAFIYQSVAPAWPPGIKGRMWRMAAVVWFLSALFFEFFTPFNLLGEPIPLIGLELTFWGIVAVVEALVLVTVFEWKTSRKVQSA